MESTPINKKRSGILGLKRIMKTLLTPDPRDFFDNSLLNFEYGSLMSKMNNRSLSNPPPLSILSFIRIASIKAGSWEHTIAGS